MASAVLISVDGGIGDPAAATIPVLDDGLLRGDGAFEFIRLYAGHPFALSEHLARLRRSADAIELPYDGEALAAEIEQLLAAAGEPDAGMRIVITRGGRRIVTIESLPDWPELGRIALVTLSPSEILAGVKSISYAGNMQASRIAAARGADEAVLVRPDGVVLEAPTSSIFWVGADGALRTPALETGILASITRERLLVGMGVETGAYAADELRGAREAFLASTTREVQPLAAVDGEPLPTAPGARSRQALEVLREAVERERAVARR